MTTEAPPRPPLDHLVEMIGANVSASDWTQQLPEWRDAAAKWRDTYHGSAPG